MLSARQSLREATAGLHNRVDQAFGHFDLGNAASYARFLSAHARALPKIEEAARASVEWLDWTPRMALLAADLQDLRMACPPALDVPPVTGEAGGWGLLYVLEGSRLGGAMLARAVGPEQPLRYLSAAHAKGSWQTFQAELERSAERGGNAWLGSAIEEAHIAFGLFERAANLEMETPVVP